MSALPPADCPPYVSAAERRRMPRVRERLGPGELVVEYTTMGRVQVDAQTCTGCRLCVRICPAQALTIVGEHDVRMIGEHSACIACGDCVAICAPQSVELVRAIRYEGYYKTVGRGPLRGPRLF